ncbi:MAG: DUF3489 domain-containing protein [Hyphomicrobium sp.]|jgi:hypothetical protein|nr:DUF3489 domain-containing protein [Hyphomicrobium sp.]
MTTVESRVPTESKRTKSATTAKSEKHKATEKRSSKHTVARKLESSDDLHAARVTKHDRILAMLNHRDGVSIPEIMEATSWQQHSVRGFLAGTIKKKLGLALTSSKTAGNLRRYRIDTKRGR